MTRRQIDWDAVAREYNASDMPVAEIACKHGLSPINIYAKAKRDGWARPGVTGDTGKAKKPVRRRLSKRAGSPPKKPAVISYGDVNSSRALGRMMGIVNRLADELEQHLDHPKKPGMSATEKKGAADILTSLARALEKLTVLEREASNHPGADKQTENVKEANIAGADDCWEEVQRRLARYAAGAAKE